jgi:hypothetical protein
LDLLWYHASSQLKHPVILGLECDTALGLLIKVYFNSGVFNPRALELSCGVVGVVLSGVESKEKS